ncbi:MAG: hypothetical protein UR22_C0001G0028 [Parcubacteria group bacterium GW2011_GWC2_32_10]|nr:MAG: hypothetical protein UR22_C0001G0028 [Parcubacteria group bacterium GW2011_GWC2_32_10]
MKVLVISENRKLIDAVTRKFYDGNGTVVISAGVRNCFSSVTEQSPDVLIVDANVGIDRAAGVIGRNDIPRCILVTKPGQEVTRRCFNDELWIAEKSRGRKGLLRLKVA